MNSEKVKKLVPYSKKITLGESLIHNLGIIAKKDIKKGEAIFTIKGQLKFVKATNIKMALYGANWIGIEKHTWIKPIGYGRYINHSCNPNAGIKGRVIVTALKDIKKGEEVTIDYSITEINKLWYMRCHCGGRDCVKKVRSIQFLPQEKYQSYMPYIPTRFQRYYLMEHELSK